MTDTSLLDPIAALANLAEHVRAVSAKPDEIVDLIEAEMIVQAHDAAQNRDAGRIDVPPVLRDRVLTIRARANAAFNAVGGVWTTEAKIAAAETDLLRLAEEALAALRNLRETRP